MTDRLNQNDVLNFNDELTAADGRTKLVMQADGNLVIYRNDTGAAVWATGTNGSGATHAIMQGDGNLVLYDGGTGAKWATGTNGNPGASAVLENEGDLQVLNVQGAKLWSSPAVPFGHIVISPQHKKWQQDYYGIASLDYDPATRLTVVHQDITNTFKLAGVTVGARALFYGGDGGLLGSQDWSTYCPQAPLVGAAHESNTWQATAPQGTEGVALSQYYHPQGLAQLGLQVEQFFGNVVNIINGGINATTDWCNQNPTTCAAVTFTLIAIAGTALCISLGPAVCTVEIVLIS